MRIARTVLSVLVILMAVGSAVAQDRKPLPPDEQTKYVVSAKAGVVNLVEGDVTFKREKTDWDRLIAGDELREGDAVMTGADGRAEILLTPGCYLRLAENTEFALVNPSVNGFAIEVRKGSAIVEASALDEPLTVLTPKTKFTVIRVGLYRFYAGADGKSEVAVRKGRVVVGETVVKGDKKATVENGSPVVAALDKKAIDSFDAWSKYRAQTLIAANKRLSNRAIKRSLTNGFVSNLWIRDSACGCYTFLPFTAGFSSPYGLDYSVCNPYWPRAWRGYGPGGYGQGGYGGNGGGYGGNPGNGGGSAGRPSGGGTNGGGGGVGTGRPVPIERPGRGGIEPGGRGRSPDLGGGREIPRGGRRP
ncbi:MAG: FecR domain-containing protein [Blastocatellia bacterium]